MIALVLIALTVAAPELSEEGRARIAKDIAEASPDLDTAIMLVATGEAESGFRESIEHCHCGPGECDGGHSFGLYQLQGHWLFGHSAAEVCNDNALSTRLAARTLGILRSRTGSPEGTFVRYVGARTVKDPHVAGRLRRYRELWAALP